MNELAYGIDFGTSNSAIVVARADGTMAQVRDPGSPIGLSSVPSSVCVLRDGRLVVGRAAENAKRLRPSAFRSEFKRDFGGRTPASLDGRQLLPDELTSSVLGFLREQAAEQVPGTVGRVVISVPAAWEAGNHALMVKAAERAGFDPGMVELVAEPVAALAHAFGMHTGQDRSTVLVYDLGGGTFDCAIAEGNRDGYQVLGAPGGVGDVGGVAFDRELLRLVRARCGEGVAALLDGSAADTAVLRRRLSLKDTCEAFKCQLSVAESHEDLLTELVPPAVFELSRVDLEEAVRPLLEETLEECDRLLAENGLTWDRIDRVVPVGGSSRIPLVGRMLAEHTGRTVLRVDDPDLAIVRGAARIAATARSAGAAQAAGTPPRSRGCAPTESAGQRPALRKLVEQVHSRISEYQSRTGSLSFLYGQAHRTFRGKRTGEPAGDPANADWPFLTPTEQADGEEFRSGHSICTTRIEFGNATGFLVWVFWIDYQGKPQYYRVLASGESNVEHTYLTHPWIVGDADGQVWGPFLPQPFPARVLVRDRDAGAAP